MHNSLTLQQNIKLLFQRSLFYHVQRIQLLAWRILPLITQTNAMLPTHITLHRKRRFLENTWVVTLQLHHHGVSVPSQRCHITQPMRTMTCAVSKIAFLLIATLIQLSRPAEKCLVKLTLLQRGLKTLHRYFLNLHLPCGGSTCCYHVYTGVYTCVRERW